MNTHDSMRCALRKHGISDDELAIAVAARGVPHEDVSRLVEHFVAGGRVAVIVAAAIIDVIVAQAGQTRH